MANQLAYLERLGISYYVPRFVLPGALPSVALAFDTQQEIDGQFPSHKELPSHGEHPSQGESIPSTEAGANAEAGEHARDQGRASLSAFVGDKPVAKTEASGVDKPVVTAQENTAAVQFKASLVDSGAGILMLAPVSAGPLDNDSKRLLANIAQAAVKHYQLPYELQFNAAHFGWPMHNIPGIEQGLVAAREAFTASVLARLELKPQRLLLVFGDELVAYLDTVLLEQHGVQCVFSEPTAKLLNNPNGKAELWRQLKAIRFAVTE
ncbi:hypothetical protein IB286_05080 [Spongiibacter sp. KMU-158]|uniref:Uracil DNA glycosylase superfamily protein n=1 Tax=Spongiibacter pelagi TaxID=2760804 RepID=A0A927GV76_9GAMM|nr:hypothetical protein [Spongiibacter pelagi]MBD2858376.1 hypothetical protein [Spongiibacter pelagi]